MQFFGINSFFYGGIEKERRYVNELLESDKFQQMKSDAEGFTFKLESKRFYSFQFTKILSYNFRKIT
jgi:hypothetical protein